MAQVSENFSTATKKDGATTADWNTGSGRLTLAGGAQSQTRYSGAVVEENPGGVYQAWSNPGGARVANSDVASIALSSGNTSRFLKHTNFGFNIPYGATITGVLVEIFTAFSWAGDNWAGIRLVKGNVIEGSTGHQGNLPGNTGWNWNYSGGNGDLWAGGLSSDVINASNFGCVHRQTDYSGYVTYADEVRITVYYTYYAADSNLGQSLSIDDTSQNIPRATLNKVDSVPGGLSILYYLTNNGGANWYQVIPGVEYTFPTTGADLRFKITLHGTYTQSPPYVDSVTIDYVTTPMALSFSDGISASDSCGKQPRPVFADLVSLSDSFSWIKGVILTINETLHLTEGISKSFWRTFEDNITLVENIGKKTMRTVNEVFGLSDSMVKKTSLVIAETLNLSEIFVKKISKRFSDSISLAETLFIKFRSISKKLIAGIFKETGNAGVSNELKSGESIDE